MKKQLHTLWIVRTQTKRQRHRKASLVIKVNMIQELECVMCQTLPLSIRLNVSHCLQKITRRKLMWMLLLVKNREHSLWRFNWKNDQCVSSHMSVFEDEEKLIGHTKNKLGTDIEEPVINLGGHLPLRTVVRAEDVEIKRILTHDGGKIKMAVMYQN